MAVCVCACRLAGNKARRLSTPQAQGRQAALLGSWHSEHKCVATLQLLDTCKKGEWRGETRGVLSMWATVANLYGCLYKCRSCYSDAERKSRNWEQGGAGGYHLEKQRLDAFAEIQSILLYNEVINKTNKVKEGKSTSWPDDAVAESDHDGSWGDCNTE